jgi:hypothetical protein
LRRLYSGSSRTSPGLRLSLSSAACCFCVRRSLISSAAAQAAEALRPIAGALAETIFALGVIGTGLLSVPVLAGSAAYAVGEARKWPTGLARQPMEAKAFYAVICIATIVGMIMNFTPIDPIRALYWSAVINGVVAVPVMAIMMCWSPRRRSWASSSLRGGSRRSVGRQPPSWRSPSQQCWRPHKKSRALWTCGGVVTRGDRRLERMLETEVVSASERGL